MVFCLQKNEIFNISLWLLTVKTSLKKQSPHLDRSHVGAIVYDVKNFVREVSVSFMYTKRSCNEAAHVMARLVDQFSGSVWCNENPNAIQALLCNDVLR